MDVVADAGAECQSRRHAEGSQLVLFRLFFGVIYLLRRESTRTDPCGIATTELSIGVLGVRTSCSYAAGEDQAKSFLAVYYDRLGQYFDIDVLL